MSTIQIEKINQELNRKKTADFFKFAEKHGIKKGWTLTDYALDAINRHGWESTCISGPKGTLKSNLLIQFGNALYQNIQTTDNHMITEKKQFINKMQYAIENEICMAWLGIDDCAALFPRSLYFTHRKLYSKLQANWETVRVAMANLMFTCVLKHKVASFLLEDITGDIKCYNGIFTANGTPIKSHYDYRRWIWLRDPEDPKKDIAKPILIEDIPFPATPDSFKIDKQLSEGQYVSGGVTYTGYEFYEKRARLTGVLTSDFRNYWNRRVTITKDSWSDFVSVFDEAPQAPKLTKEERSEINRNNGKKGLETQKHNRQQKHLSKNGEVAK